MQINYQINAHLDRREPCCVLDAVQGESGRAVTVSLYEKEQPWTIPENARVMVRYGRPDGCGGIYDTLSDGAHACTCSGNTVTAVLIPQALAVAGLVSFQLAIVAQQQELATFIFLVRVESDPSKETAAAEEVVSLLPELATVADRAEAAANRAEQAAQFADSANISAGGFADVATHSATQAQASAEAAAASAQTAAASAPVRGIDYWTEADKAEIKAYVDEAILGGAW